MAAKWGPDVLFCMPDRTDCIPLVRGIAALRRTRDAWIDAGCFLLRVLRSMHDVLHRPHLAHPTPACTMRFAFPQHGKFCPVKTRTNRIQRVLFRMQNTTIGRMQSRAIGSHA
jgi:hypothetical protein